MNAKSVVKACAAALMIASLAAGCSDAPIEQPIQFNHKKHVDLGFECDTCHRYYETSTFAGLPNIDVCTECHEAGASENPELKKLDGYASRNELIPWKRIYHLPEHVFYSHRRHVVVGGLPCEGCHGAIAQTTSPPRYPLVNQRMFWCLDCHEKRGVTQDCIHCHE